MTNIFNARNTFLTLTLLQFICVGPCAADNFFSSLFKSDETKAVAANNVASSIATLKENMEVRGLDFSPDGKYLAATSTTDSDEVHIWDWQAASIVRKMKKGAGSADTTTTEPLKYSPDGKYLVACHGITEKNIVMQIWEAQTGNLVHFVEETQMEDCSAIGFTPDGQWLVRVGSIGRKPNDSIIVYGTKDWKPAWSLRTLPFYPNTLTISPDGRFAAVGGNTFAADAPREPQIRIIDLTKRAISKTIDSFPLNSRTRSLAWHPDGKHVAAGAMVGGAFKGPGIVRIFDASSEKQLAGETVQAPEAIDVLRYSPDGKYLVEGPINGSIRIWDGQHKNLLQEFQGEAASLAFSRDGRYLAMGGRKKIVIWQMR
jgi:WD40 repeat protein